MRDIYVLGSLNTDLVISSNRIPKAGETLTGTGFSIHPGGKGANQAVAAARLGGKVYFCGCLGNDVFGKNIIENCKINNVDVSCVRSIDNISSGVASITLVDNDNRILLYPGANHHVSIEDVDVFLKTAKPNDIFMAQLEIPNSVVEYGIKRAKEMGLTTVFNPAPANISCLSFLDKVDILVLNYSEICLLGNTDNIETACKTLFERGSNKIVVTLGEKGYLYIDRTSEFHGSAHKVEVVDTTGAGDAFCGGLVYGLSIGYSLHKALYLASLIGSVSVQKLGAQTSYPSREELDNFIKSHFLINLDF